MTLVLLDRYRDVIVEGLRAALAGDGPLDGVLRYHTGLADRDGQPADALGKLLRPALVLLIAEELGGEIERALPAAVGLELIHGFSLIHDDVQDRDEMRRGRPTVWTLWGVAEAINAGDLMHAIAVRQALKAGPEAAHALLAATSEMIEGQSFDLSFEDRFVPPADVLGMMDRKTGALFRCAFELGGLVSDAEADVRGRLRQLGVSIGRAFQIQDDLLGIWGDGDVVGKPVGSDIRRRKKSYPIALGYDGASTEERANLERLYEQEPMGADDVSWVVGLLDRLDVRGQGCGAVEEYLADARAALDGTAFSTSGRTILLELVEFLARRVS